jgi:hypothetical protein
VESEAANPHSKGSTGQNHLDRGGKIADFRVRILGLRMHVFNPQSEIADRASIYLARLGPITSEFAFSRPELDTSHKGWWEAHN